MRKKKLKTIKTEEMWITIDDDNSIWKSEFKPKVNEKIGYITQKEARKMDTVESNFIFNPYEFMSKGRPTLMRFTVEVVKAPPNPAPQPRTAIETQMNA